MVGCWTRNRRVVGSNPTMIQLVSKSSKCEGRPLMWQPGSCGYYMAALPHIHQGIENILIYIGPMTTSKVYSPLSRITGNIHIFF